MEKKRSLEKFDETKKRIKNKYSLVYQLGYLDHLSNLLVGAIKGIGNAYGRDLNPDVLYIKGGISALSSTINTLFDYRIENQAKKENPVGSKIEDIASKVSDGLKITANGSVNGSVTKRSEQDIKAGEKADRVFNYLGLRIPAKIIGREIISAAEFAIGYGLAYGVAKLLK